MICSMKCAGALAEADWESLWSELGSDILQIYSYSPPFAPFMCDFMSRDEPAGPLGVDT